MKLISHRGNIIGPKPNRENSPSYIDTAISAGYDVEIDIRYINDKFYLGHDTPDYEVSETWIKKRKDKLWIHCKNLEAASIFSKMEDINFFCHTSDTFVLTSNNYIWVHDLKLNIDNRCIIPLLSDIDVAKYNGNVVYAVCTDYITFAAFNLKQKGLYK
jgi:hypothetical protein